jgi:hypothetical protein
MRGDCPILILIRLSRFAGLLSCHYRETNEYVNFFMYFGMLIVAAKLRGKRFSLNTEFGVRLFSARQYA